MNIAPPPEFQQAFEEIFGKPCTPGNLIPAIRSGDPRINEVKIRATTYREAESTFPKNEEAKTESGETTASGLYVVSIHACPPEPLTLDELRARVPGIRWTDHEIEAGITAFRPFHVTDPGVPRVRISANAND